MGAPYIHIYDISSLRVNCYFTVLSINMHYCYHISNYEMCGADIAYGQDKGCTMCNIVVGKYERIGPHMRSKRGLGNIIGRNFKGVLSKS